MSIGYPNDSYYQLFNNKFYEQEPWEVAEERFRKRFEMHVETSKRNYRYRPVPINYKMWDQNLPVKHDVEREALLKVYISKDNYERLVKGEQQIEQLERENYRFRRLEEKNFDEMAARNNNPALKKAWDNYQLLLKLVHNG